MIYRKSEGSSNRLTVNDKALHTYKCGKQYILRWRLNSNSMLLSCQKAAGGANYHLASWPVTVLHQYKSPVDKNAFSNFQN